MKSEEVLSKIFPAKKSHDWEKWQRRIIWDNRNHYLFVMDPAETEKISFRTNPMYHVRTHTVAGLGNAVEPLSAEATHRYIHDTAPAHHQKRKNEAKFHRRHRNNPNGQSHFDAGGFFPETAKSLDKSTCKVPDPKDDR